VVLAGCCARRGGDDRGRDGDGKRHEGRPVGVSHRAVGVHDVPDEPADPPALVCQVGSTKLTYHLRAIEDLHEWLANRAAGCPRCRRRAEGRRAWDRRGLRALARQPVGGWYGCAAATGTVRDVLPPLLRSWALRAHDRRRTTGSSVRAWCGPLRRTRPGGTSIPSAASWPRRWRAFQPSSGRRRRGCAGWSVQQAAGTWSPRRSRLRSTSIDSSQRRFSASTSPDRDAKRLGALPPSELVSRLQARTSTTQHPPAPVLAMLGEVIVHGADIRRPLGARLTRRGSSQWPSPAAGPVQPAHRRQRRIAGVRSWRLTAEWSYGRWPAVSGRCLLSAGDDREDRRARRPERRGWRCSPAVPSELGAARHHNLPFCVGLYFGRIAYQRGPAHVVGRALPSALVDGACSVSLTSPATSSRGDG